jgi:hypothetical protein
MQWTKECAGCPLSQNVTKYSKSENGSTESLHQSFHVCNQMTKPGGPSLARQLGASHVRRKVWRVLSSLHV